MSAKNVIIVSDIRNFHRPQKPGLAGPGRQGRNMASKPKAARVWHPEDIKAEVRKRGGTLSSVARSVGLADGSGRMAFLQPIPTANRAIAAFIGVPVNELWPQWFDADGNRKSSPPKAKDNRTGRRGHRQKTVEK